MTGTPANKEADDENKSQASETSNPDEALASAQPSPTSTAPEIAFDRNKTFEQDLGGLITPKEIRVFNADLFKDDESVDAKRRFYWSTEDKYLQLLDASLLSNGNTGKSLGKDYGVIFEDPDNKLFLSRNSTGVSLDLSLFLSKDKEFGDLVSHLTTLDSHHFLAIKLDWVKENKETGYSISPYFAVISDPALTSTLYESVTNEIMQGDNNLNGWDGIDSGAKPDPSASETPEHGDGGDDGDDGDSGDSGDSGGGDNELVGVDKDDSDDGSSGTLSTGAIAGIAVGGAVVLIAIAVLIWFVLRRRRRNKTKGRAALSQSPNPSNHYIGGKEVHDGDLNSPYSEDGANITQQTPLDPNAPRARTAESSASFAPYQDVGGNQHNPERAGTSASVNTHGNSPVETASRGHPTRSNTAMSASHNVAHLVEDGMTEDDIRRLEEEERQLDFEIERAGRR